MVDRQLNDDCIVTHNELRELHGCPPLTFDAELARSAQKWADYIASSGNMKHSGGSDYGENLAMRSGSGNFVFSGKQATDDWYSEINDYNFGQENQMQSGHFSQVVWKSTERAGFGRAKAPDGRQFIVGQYRPPGNFMNQWNKNVPPLQGGGGSVRAPKNDAPSRASSGFPNSPPTSPTARQIATSDSPKQLQPQTSGPRSSNDRLVSRGTRTRTVNGVKTVTVTETYETSSGERYEVVNETTEGGNNSGGFDGNVGGGFVKGGRVSDMMMGDDDDGRIMVRRIQMQRSAPKSRSRPSDKVDGNGTRSSSSSSASSKEYRGKTVSLDDFRHDLVKQHNHYRQQHNVPELRQAEELNHMAQDWAEHLQTTRLKPQCPWLYKGEQVGESVEVLVYDGDKISGKELGKKWYAEGKQHKYPYGFEPREKTKVCSKFTQMLWLESEEIGVGRLTDSDGVTWIVCLYSPKGNVLGRYDSNVLPVAHH